MSTLRLAVEIGGAGHHPGAWRHAGAHPDRLVDAGYHVELARTAERGTLDFVAIPDSFAPPPAALPAPARGRLDAVAIAARVAPATRGVGLVPTATTTHTEPFHLSKAIATLDYVSHGRAGWEADVSRTEAEARLFGRKHAAPPEDLYAEAADAIEVVTRLWDSWEDDAVIRDVATGRYVDRDRLHPIDFAGRFFSVKGPSITPRPPQGRPPVVLRVDDDEAWVPAARHADVVRTSAPDLETARSFRARIRAAVEAAGRDPAAVAVLVDVVTQLGHSADAAQAGWDELDRLGGRPWRPESARFAGTPSGLADLVEEWFHEGAADGFVVRPVLLPDGLTALADGVVPALRDRGLFRRAYPGRTLRDTFGLARPASRYAA